MTGWQHKKIQSIESFGEKLKRNREDRGLSLPRLARKLNINSKYLQALENDDYKKLPPDIYTINFIRQYSKFLGVSPASAVSTFEKQKNLTEKVLINNNLMVNTKPSTWSRFWSFVLKPKVIRNTLIFLIFGGICVYLGLSINNIFTSPELVITNPTTTQVVTDQRTINIAGVTEKEAELNINNLQVILSPTGKFSLDIDLQDGLNIIKISAKKKHSQTNTIYRQVIVTNTTK